MRRPFFPPTMTSNVEFPTLLVFATYKKAVNTKGGYIPTSTPSTSKVGLFFGLFCRLEITSQFLHNNLTIFYVSLSHRK